MPRQARIDAPGALHHIIARGIDREAIFKDDNDRFNFISRLDKVLSDTKTPCYAWALIPNHFHLLLRSGIVPIATVMRRLLTGYAVSFNQRHHRRGHLFQNRYKSILCQEEIYFKELIRYIHLNPYRAGLVKEHVNLAKYPFCGHGTIMGKTKRPWQKTEEVLALFGTNIGLARRAYNRFVKQGIHQGKRPDLTGGGLVRSIGGWEAIKASRKAGQFQKADERILGDSDFVSKVMMKSDEILKRKYVLQNKGVTLEVIADRVALVLDMKSEDIWKAGRNRRVVKARSLLCYWAVRELGMSMTSLASKLNISITAVSKAVGRGEKLVQENRYIADFN
jgi:REP element-mobilizing transposase RayT